MRLGASPFVETGRGIVGRYHQAEVVRDAVEAGFGSRPIDIPLVGGSLPDAVWTKTLGLPSSLVSYGDPPQANHSPNESYAVERFEQGIVTSAALLGGLAGSAT